MSLLIGRYSELNSLEEVKDLKIGMDFRNPIYIGEKFFYGFMGFI